MDYEQVVEEVNKILGLTEDESMVWLNFSVKKSVRDLVILPAIALATKNMPESQKVDDEGNHIDPSKGAAMECICADFLASPEWNPRRSQKIRLPPNDEVAPTREPVPNLKIRGHLMTRQLDPTRASSKATALSTKFKSRIIGQPEAAQSLLNVIEKFQSGFYDRTKPIASLLFLGPTGTGKTGTVEAFVEGLFGKSTAMMKIDCAEFQHSHEIAKLLGSPPGYLGHRETHPYFTNASVQGYKTSDCPYTVILFDEIEKANDALWNLLLGILDKGQVTTGTNELVDLRATIIIMTSNVGSKELAKRVGDGAIGFNTAGEDVNHEEATEIAMSAATTQIHARVS